MKFEKGHKPVNTEKMVATRRAHRWNKSIVDDLLNKELTEMGYRVMRFWEHDFVDLKKIRNIFRGEMGLSLI